MDSQKYEIFSASESTGQEYNFVSAKVFYYANRYRIMSRLSAESILSLAKTLSDIEENLSKHDFKAFCAEVGLEIEGATHRKLRKIGH